MRQDLDGSARSCAERSEVSILGLREESIAIALVEVALQKEKRMEVDDALMDYV